MKSQSAVPAVLKYGIKIQWWKQLSYTFDQGISLTSQFHGYRGSKRFKIPFQRSLGMVFICMPCRVPGLGIRGVGTIGKVGGRYYESQPLFRSTTWFKCLVDIQMRHYLKAETLSSMIRPKSLWKNKVIILAEDFFSSHQLFASCVLRKFVQHTSSVPDVARMMNINCIMWWLAEISAWS